MRFPMVELMSKLGVGRNEIRKQLTKIQLIRGDIVEADVDAVVNAANRELKAGAGVCGAIHAAAGPRLQLACVPLAPVPTGGAVITPGFRLRAKYVIHAVGPIWCEGVCEEDKALEITYRSALKVAYDHGLKTIAFPAISTGVYAFPKELAANIAMFAILEGLTLYREIQRIELYCFDEETYTIYQGLLEVLQREIPSRRFL